MQSVPSLNPTHCQHIIALHWAQLLIASHGNKSREHWWHLNMVIEVKFSNGYNVVWVEDKKLLSGNISDLDDKSVEIMACRGDWWDIWDEFLFLNSSRSVTLVPNSLFLFVIFFVLIKKFSTIFSIADEELFSLEKMKLAINRVEQLNRTSNV